MVESREESKKEEPKEISVEEARRILAESRKFVSESSKRQEEFKAFNDKINETLSGAEAFDTKWKKF